MNYKKIHIAMIIVFALFLNYAVFAKPSSEHCFFPYDEIELPVVGTQFPMSWQYSFDKLNYYPTEGDYSNDKLIWQMPFSYSDSLYLKSTETNLTAPDLVWTFNYYNSEVSEVILSGDTLFCLSKNGVVQMLQITTKSIIKQVQIETNAVPYCMALVGPKAYIGLDSSFICWDIDKNTLDYSLFVKNKFNGAVRSVARLGEEVIFASMDGTLRKYNSENDSLAVLIDKSASDNFYSVAVSPDGRYAGAGSYFGNIYYYDFANNKIDSIINIHGNNGVQSVIWDLAFSGNSQSVISTGVDTKLAYSRLTEGKLKEYSGHTGHSRRCGYFDEELVWAAGLDSSFMMWSLKPGTHKPFVLSHGNPIVSADYNSDTKYLALGGRQGEISIWRFHIPQQINNVFAKRIKYRFVLSPSDVSSDVGEQKKVHFYTSNIYPDTVQNKIDYKLKANVAYDKDVLYLFETDKNIESDYINGTYKLINGYIDSLNCLFLRSNKNSSELEISGKEIDTSRWEVIVRKSNATVGNTCKSMYGIGISNVSEKSFTVLADEGILQGSFNAVETGLYRLSVINILGQIIFEKKYYSKGGEKVDFKEIIIEKDDAFMIINISAPSYSITKKIIRR